MKDQEKTAPAPEFAPGKPKSAPKLIRDETPIADSLKLSKWRLDKFAEAEINKIWELEKAITEADSPAGR